MTSIRSELAKTARFIINEYGENLQIRRSSVGNYDVDTGVRSFTTDVYQIRVVFVRDEKDESQDLTRTESRRAYIAPVDCQTIETSDVIIGVNSDMKISRIHEVFSGIDGGPIYVCTVQG